MCETCPENTEATLPRIMDNTHKHSEKKRINSSKNHGHYKNILRIKQ